MFIGERASSPPAAGDPAAPGVTKKRPILLSDDDDTAADTHGRHKTRLQRSAKPALDKTQSTGRRRESNAAVAGDTADHNTPRTPKRRHPRKKGDGNGEHGGVRKGPAEKGPPKGSLRKWFTDQDAKEKAEEERERERLRGL